MAYAQFFRKATGFAPYPYQSQLAEGTSLPNLLRVPTGAGKTEAAVLGWLYRRFEHPAEAVRDSMARRLVYCLPARVLLDQTAYRVREWLLKLGMAHDVGVVTIMGGEPPRQWYLAPEKPFIVVGTQDMLLSRALNRGYGMSCNMWPVDYGLLNNDCLWVMDEVQLMANGMPTSTQLAGLRGKLKTLGPAQSLWMSATTCPGWLSTIDHSNVGQIAKLGSDDLADPRLRKRHHALKLMRKAPADLKGTKELARYIKDIHQRGTLTLMTVNTVDRAQKLYAELAKELPDVEKVLAHSCFREDDRQQKQRCIATPLDPAGRVVVATQAVEAGVDMSARTLVTELAPWASMVQRFGRCNREGKYDRGDVWWLDVEGDSAPYDVEDISDARAIMKSLQGKSVAPAELEDLGDKIKDVDHRIVIRRRDVLDLFDTAPDLSGSYVDVSQYVGGSDETGITVFWRYILGDDPDTGTSKVRHNETVNVPIGGTRGGPKGIRGYLESGRTAWRWDFLDSMWRRIYSHEIHPGMTLMLDANRGGYTSAMGWDVSSREPVPVMVRDGEPEDGQGSEPTNTRKKPVTLREHSRHVEYEARVILDALSAEVAEQEIREAVLLAALYHDVGKAHCAFQEMLGKGCGEKLDKETLWAKSPGNGTFDGDRRHFRHELASALALLALPESDTRDLAAYLAAAHHGKVRLAIRSLPGERVGRKDSNPNPDSLFGHPVSKRSTLSCVDLGEGLLVPETTLDMSIAQIGVGENGRQSWLERSLTLLERYGPFRLAYLETIVRAADMRASAREQGETIE